MIDPRGVLMIEPTGPASAEPTIDYFTYMAAMVYEATTLSAYASKGWHTCICGVASDNRDHILPDKRVTNSLAVHYVAYHRHEVPSAELSKIDRLFKELYPNFDIDAFDQDTDRQRALISAIPVN